MTGKLGEFPRLILFDADEGSLCGGVLIFQRGVLCINFELQVCVLLKPSVRTQSETLLYPAL